MTIKILLRNELCKQGNEEVYGNHHEVEKQEDKSRPECLDHELRLEPVLVEILVKRCIVIV